jgi:hypothetical protein
VRPEGPETTKIRDSRGQSLRRQATERALDDRILDPQAGRNTGLIPKGQRAVGLLSQSFRVVLTM